MQPPYIKSEQERERERERKREIERESWLSTRSRMSSALIESVTINSHQIRL